MTGRPNREAGDERAGGYTDTESKRAKRLKKLIRDEGGEIKHMRALQLVRQYGAEARGRTTEEFVALVWEHWLAGGAT